MQKIDGQKTIMESHFVIKKQKPPAIIIVDRLVFHLSDQLIGCRLNGCPLHCIPHRMIWAKQLQSISDRNSMFILEFTLVSFQQRGDRCFSPQINYRSNQSIAIIVIKKLMPLWSASHKNGNQLICSAHKLILSLSLCVRPVCLIFTTEYWMEYWLVGDHLSYAEDQC